MSLKSIWNNVTPWNTQDERNQNAENQLKILQAETAAKIQQQQAGIMDSNTLAALQAKAGNNLYLILGGALVIIVIAVFYFKSRRK